MIFACVCVSEMGQRAAELALKDAGVEYSKIQAVAASYCYGDPTSGMDSMETYRVPLH